MITGGYMRPIQYFATMIMTLVLSLATAYGYDMPVVGVAPDTVSSDIQIGDDKSVLEFDVNGVESIKIEAIVPITNSVVNLYDPNGSLIRTSNNGGFQYNSGETLKPGSNLPGGVFTSDEILKPTNGKWALEVKFPSATYRTSILVTIQSRTKYIVSLISDRDDYIKGENVFVGALVTDTGQPITALNPKLTIKKINTNDVPIILDLMDDGQGADGKINDGLYSSNYIFNTTGSYLLETNVELITTSGIVTKQSAKQIIVKDPIADITNKQLVYNNGVNNCINSIGLNTTISITEPGEYVLSAILSASNQKNIENRVRKTLLVGSNNVGIVFTKDQLINELGANGPYKITEIKLIKILTDTVQLAYKDVNPMDTIGINLANTCITGIEILPQLNVTPILKNGFIEKLNVKIPIKVSTSGYYNATIKVVGPNGEDIDLLNGTYYFVVGSNMAEYNVHAGKFLKVDGSYSIISMLVTGPAGSGQLSFVGKTNEYSKWQFLPRINGDLNDNGVVDAADRDILLQFRGVNSLAPGDRRDVNKDGKIDIIDTRAILSLACTSTKCIKNY